MRMVMNMTTTHRDDSIDDGGLLDGDAQGLHVQVQERVEDGHRGRLEEEDQLYTNQMSHSEVLEDPAKDRHEAADTSEPLKIFSLILADLYNSYNVPT